MKKILIGIFVLALIVVAFLIFSNENSTGSVVEETAIIKIPLKDITSKAIFYENEGSNYFAVKASDGSIKTAFDACDVCGGEKGYRQEGGDMVCNNCGRHFAINSLGEKNIYDGGCWPSHLENKIEGDNILIKRSDLAAGSFRF